MINKTKQNEGWGDSSMNSADIKSLHFFNTSSNLVPLI